MSDYPNSISPPDRPAVIYKRTPRGQVVAWLSVAVVLLFLLGFATGLLIWRERAEIRCALEECDKNPVGMPVPWNELLSIAHEAAQEAAPGAIPIYIDAQPLAQWARDWSVEKTLEVTFTYQDPRGLDFYVAMHDTDPRATVEVWGPAFDPDIIPTGEDAEAGQLSGQELRAEAAEFYAILAKVKVSPRQAEVLTWNEAMAEARNDNTEVEPWIGLVPAYSTWGDDFPPTWYVDYDPVPADGPLKVPDESGVSELPASSSSFEVDATTGEITYRDTGDSSPSP